MYIIAQDIMEYNIFSLFQTAKYPPRNVSVVGRITIYAGTVARTSLFAEGLYVSVADFTTLSLSAFCR